MDEFFSSSRFFAYEIDRGKLLRRGRYEFPVVLVTPNRKTSAPTADSPALLWYTGHNDWAVDKLP